MDAFIKGLSEDNLSKVARGNARELVEWEIALPFALSVYNINQLRDKAKKEQRRRAKLNQDWNIASGLNLTHGGFGGVRVSGAGAGDPDDDDEPSDEEKDPAPDEPDEPRRNPNNEPDEPDEPDEPNEPDDDPQQKARRKIKKPRLLRPVRRMIKRGLLAGGLAVAGVSVAPGADSVSASRSERAGTSAGSNGSGEGTISGGAGSVVIPPPGAEPLDPPSATEPVDPPSATEPVDPPSATEPVDPPSAAAADPPPAAAVEGSGAVMIPPSSVAGIKPTTQTAGNMGGGGNSNYDIPYKIPRTGHFNMVEWTNYTREAARRAGVTGSSSEIRANNPFF